jgi:hypothetical protein
LFISEVVIPQMFTAYAEDMGYLENGLHEYQYFCEECDQAFTSAWGRVPGSFNGCERGTRVYCPYCGILHEKHIGLASREVHIPHKVRLTLTEFKDAVLFKVFSQVVLFTDRSHLNQQRYSETYRFDIAKQTTTMTSALLGRRRYVSPLATAECGDPFEMDFMEKSILGFFQAHSLANTHQEAELTGILRELRETVQAKIEKRFNHKIKPLFVSQGTIHGTFLLPILNIAFRLKFPDAPNLPPMYRLTPGHIRNFWRTAMVGDDSLLRSFFKSNSKTDFITTIITVCQLPNKDAVRKEIHKSFLAVGGLIEAFKLCSNYDLALRLYTGIKQILPEHHYLNTGRLLTFLRLMLPIYGEAGIVQMVEQEKENIYDCEQIYNQLNAANMKAIVAEGVKVKELHDWMAKRHRLQRHKNIKFTVPDHIVKRLAMQTGRLKFFLPKESIELLEAGAELHNCVASYGDAVKDHKKWVVLVADDKGKLSACLEVRGKELVQAKIAWNKPVASDAKLNAEVIAWAKEAGLEIKTADVKRTIERLADAI